jgi:Big-like domain-containing protein
MVRARLASGVATILLVALSGAPAAADPLGPFAPLGCFEHVVSECGAGRQLADLYTPEAIRVSPNGEQVYFAVQARGAPGGGVMWMNRDTATGALTYGGCVEDAESDAAMSCSTEGPGIGFPRDLKVSADGKSVYTVAFPSSRIARFDRDTTTGDLTYVDCWEWTTPGTPLCDPAHRIPGLVGADGLQVSPDGKSLYVFALNGEPGGTGAIVRFARDADGALTHQGCLSNDAGACGAGNTVVGIAGARDAAFSSDSASMYVTALEDESLVHFTRDTTTGALTFVDCVEHTTQSRCAVKTPRFIDPDGVVVSPDDENVYVTAGGNGDSLTRFDRNVTTGVATPIDCFTTGHDGECDATHEGDVTGLLGAAGVVVSPDGSHVYVAGRLNSAIADFTRDLGSGELTPDGCAEGTVSNATCGGAAVPGLNGVRSLAITADGLGLLAASQDDAIAWFGAASSDTPPTAVNDTATVPRDAAATTVDVLANDTNPDGGPKQVASVTQPAHGTAAVAGVGTGVTYQPAFGYCDSNAPDTFTYSVNGGSTATVSVTVVCPMVIVDPPPPDGGTPFVAPPPVVTTPPSQPPPVATPPVPLPKFAKVVTLPSAKRCASRRKFKIRIREQPGVEIARAEVFINGKKVKVVRSDRLRATVDLRGLPKGTITVRIRIVTSDGRQISGKRRYHTCATRKRKGRIRKL